MRTLILVVAVAALALVVSVEGRQSSLVPLALKAKAAAASLPTGMDASAIDSVAPGTTNGQLSSNGVANQIFGSCMLGFINQCTHENTAWDEKTASAMAGELPNQQYAELKQSQQPGGGSTFADNVPMNNFGFSEIASGAGGCAGKCQNPSLSCGTGYVHGLCPGSAVCCPTAKIKLGAAPASKCPGTCQAANSKCGVAFQHGLCPGTSLCCPSSQGSAAAAAPAASAAGVSSKVRDPVSLVKGGRSIGWGDLTATQQSNVHLLMNYAKQQGITDNNQKAYILGTASVESSGSATNMIS